MFITFDGLPGSGKTTQSDIISQKLGIDFECPKYAVSRAIESICVISCRHFRERGLIGNIIAVHSLPLNCVTENVWSSFSQFINEPRSEIDKFLPVFRTLLKASGRSEPSLSIHLDIPEELSHHRRMERDPLFKITAEQAIDLNELNSKRRELWLYIETRVPYFHVVDATRMLDEVTNSIMALLKN